MVEVRACVVFFVIFLCMQSTAGKPFFGLFCDYLCDDESSTSTSTEDPIDDYCECRPRRRRPTTPNPMMNPWMNPMMNPWMNPMMNSSTIPGRNQGRNPAMNPGMYPGMPVQFMMPNGMDMTIMNNGMGLLMSFAPGAGGGAPATPAPAAAPATPAPPAPAAATTAAAAATTAAATTAATTAAPAG